MYDCGTDDDVKDDNKEKKCIYFMTELIDDDDEKDVIADEYIKRYLTDALLKSSEEILSSFYIYGIY